MKLTLSKILNLVAEEMTRRQYEKLPSLSQFKDYESIKEQRIEKSLKLLESEIKPTPENLEDNIWLKPYQNYKPFVNHGDVKSFPDKIIVIAKPSGFEGNKLFFRLINPAAEGKSVSEILLSLEGNLLEDTYIIYKCVIQKFQIKEDRVIYDDILVIEEEENPEDKETKVGKKRKLAQIKKIEILEDEMEDLASRVYEIKAMIHSLKSGKW